MLMQQFRQVLNVGCKTKLSQTLFLGNEKRLGKWSIGFRLFYNMRLVQFEKNGERKIGVEQGVNGNVVDLSVDPEMPSNMVGFLKGGEALMKRAKE